MDLTVEEILKGLKGQEERVKQELEELTRQEEEARRALEELERAGGAAALKRKLAVLKEAEGIDVAAEQQKLKQYKEALCDVERKLQIYEEAVGIAKATRGE